MVVADINGDTSVEEVLNEEKRRRERQRVWRTKVTEKHLNSKTAVGDSDDSDVLKEDDNKNNATKAVLSSSSVGSTSLTTTQNKNGIYSCEFVGTTQHNIPPIPIVSSTPVLAQHHYAPPSSQYYPLPSPPPPPPPQQSNHDTRYINKSRKSILEDLFAPKYGGKTDRKRRNNGVTSDGKDLDSNVHNTDKHAWESLPPGWTTARNESDGRVFYWHPATGVTRWTHPAYDDHPGVAGIASGGTTGKGQPFLLPSPRTTNADDHDYVDGNQRDRRRRGRSSSSFYWDRPDSHECCACLSLVACLPMGLAAAYHARSIDRAWREGRHGDAVNHSRQAYNYACWGTVFGLALGLYWWLHYGGGSLPDWDFDFDFGD